MGTLRSEEQLSYKAYPERSYREIFSMRGDLQASGLQG